MEPLASGAARGRGPSRRDERGGEGRLGLEASATRSGRAPRRRSSTASPGRSRGCAPFYISSEPEADATLGSRRRGDAAARQPPIVRRPGWGADESIVRGAPSLRRPPRASRSSTTRPGRTATRPPSRPRSCAGSSATTCSRTAGTTSATTSSSTSTARSSKAAAGASTRTSSARTRRGSTPAASASRCSGRTAPGRISTAARDAARSACSPGGSTWPTSTRSSRSLAPRTATTAFPRGRAVRLRAVSGHRDTGSTSCPGNALYGQLGVDRPERRRASACRSSTTPRWTARSAGTSASPHAFPRRARGSSRSRTPAVPWSHRGPATGLRSTGPGTRARRPSSRTPTRSSAGPDARPATGPIPGPPPLAITGLDRVAARPHPQRRREHRALEHLVQALQARDRGGQGRERLVRRGGADVARQRGAAGRAAHRDLGRDDRLRHRRRRRDATAS